MFSRQSRDRLIAGVIRVGAGVVIVAVAAIVLNISLEAFPLFLPASAGPLQEVSCDQTPLLAGSSPRRDHIWYLDRQGSVHVGGTTVLRIFDGPAEVVAADSEIGGLVTVLDDHGRVAIGTVGFIDSWHDGVRSTQAQWRLAASRLELGETEKWNRVTANVDDDGFALVAVWRESGSARIMSWDPNFESWSTVISLADVAEIAVADSLRHIAVVQTHGELRVLETSAARDYDIVGLDHPAARVRFLIGGGSLIVAGPQRELGVAVFVPRIMVTNQSDRDLGFGDIRIKEGATAIVRDSDQSRTLVARYGLPAVSAAPELRFVRHLATTPDVVTAIAPAHRNRGFLVGAEDGSVSLYHSTSGRRLVSQHWTDQAIRSLAVDPRGDGGIAIAGGSLLRQRFDNPHPEISLRTLFLPVWYEGYGGPEWVWQSSGGSDAFEPKLSLWPLLFGTLKATLFAMVFSVPLALLAALYVSQLAPPWIQNFIKPSIEMMAGIPTVVVGFLAALWLAPRLEQHLLFALIMILSLPLIVLLAYLMWRFMPRPLRARLPLGGDLLVLVVSSAVVVLVVHGLSAPFEMRFFGGDFQRYLFTEWGLRYDQRNALVVGIGLGFAVIPVIFSIAEDACSSVPKHLLLGSRALGATRWQTATRMVVPAASPGLFAAVMLGFGRAVGETMIVLMAAGNTPLLDPSPFNGMRTMAAAIAIEIPEAPVGGSLYRVLFLTGVLLFAFTFAISTIADVVSVRLRRRYGRF